MIKTANDYRWSEAVHGDELTEGDSIKTGESSRAVLIIDNGDIIRLNSSTQVQLADMSPENVIFEQVYGETYSRVMKSEQNTYTVSTKGVETLALGTAFSVNSDSVNPTVSVFVFESSVQLNTSSSDKVDELHKAVIDTESKKAEITEISEEEYSTEFNTWNFDQDSEEGYDKDTTAPTITITEPANGYETTASSVTLKGSVSDESGLKKIIVNGTIYNTKDDGGKGFDPIDGTFDIDITLAEGTNTIVVKAYDIYWNSSESSVTVTKKTTTPPPTQPTNTFYISNISSPGAGKIYVKWYMSGYTASSGFKVAYSTSQNPTYPGSSAQYVSNSLARETTISGLSAGTYYVRVCIYNGSGACTTTYTVQKSVVVEGVPTGVVNSITLSGTGANVSWSVDGYSENGFKVVWSKTSGPTYPCRSGDQYHYLSNPEARNDTINVFDGPGTYFVRVCEYLGGSCGKYSNEIQVTL